MIILCNCHKDLRITNLDLIIQVAVVEVLVPFLDYICDFSGLCAQLMLLFRLNSVCEWKVLFLAWHDMVGDYIVTYTLILFPFEIKSWNNFLK